MNQNTKETNDRAHDDLLPGRTYRVEVDDAGKTHLRLLAQTTDNLPRIPILPDVLADMRTLQRSMRSKQLGGWRPDITLVVSALVGHGLAAENPKRIVQDYVKHHMENLEIDDN